MTERNKGLMDFLTLTGITAPYLTEISAKTSRQKPVQTKTKAVKHNLTHKNLIKYV